MKALIFIGGCKRQTKQILALLEEINERTKKMATTVAELEAKLETFETGLADVGAKLDEGFTEVVTELQKLRDELAKATIPAGAQTRLDNLTTKIASLQEVSKKIADIIT